MPPSPPPAAIAQEALLQTILLASAGAVVVTAAGLALCFWSSPFTDVRTSVSCCARWWRDMYGSAEDGSLPAPILEQLVARAANGRPTSASEWAEADVEELRRQVSAAVRAAEVTKQTADEAAARRRSLLAEAGHVADETAGQIEQVMLEAHAWEEEAYRRFPEQAEQIAFMARTMDACGQTALEPSASVEARRRATTMAGLCAQAMVSQARAHAHRADQRAAELARSVLRAKGQLARTSYELSAFEGTPEELARMQAAVEEQHTVLERAMAALAGAHATCAATASFDGSPQSRASPHSPGPPSPSATHTSRSLSSGRHAPSPPLLPSHPLRPRATLGASGGHAGRDGKTRWGGKTPREPLAEQRSERWHRKERPGREVRPSQREVRPSQREVRPSQRDVRPSQREVRPSQREVRPSQRPTPAKPKLPRSSMPTKAILTKPILTEADMDVVFEGRLPVALYDWNDLLIRVRDGEGVLLPGAQFVWKAALSGGEGQLVFLQLDGRPHLSALVQPFHRLWSYGEAGTTYAAFHLGGDRPEVRLAKRAELSTRILFGSLPAEDALDLTHERRDESRDESRAELSMIVRILAPRTAAALAAALGESGAATGAVKRMRAFELTA
jgi:hypothetical protein